MKCNRFGELANIFVCFKLNFAWAKQISASKRKHPVNGRVFSSLIKND